jgi:hypothetical protein
MSFAGDTAVTQVAPHCFTAEPDEQWSSRVGIHGGYTAAILAKAMTSAVDDPAWALRTSASTDARARPRRRPWAPERRSGPR